MMQLVEPTAESATDTSRPPRHYLPEDFTVTDWATIEPFFQELQARAVQSGPELERWLLDRSELESVLSEDLAWRYIDRKSTRLNSSHLDLSRMPSSA